MNTKEIAIGRRVERKREAANERKSDLARATGIDRIKIWRIERGYNGPQKLDRHSKLRTLQQDNKQERHSWMQNNRYTPDFKAKVVLEALREHRTINELARDYGPHPKVISEWKKQAADALPNLFGDQKARTQALEDEALKATLYQQIGQLQMELEWLKKRVGHLPQK